MQYAKDNIGNKIPASISGQKATCPLCESGVIAHCGEIYINHWKHEKYQSCDAWIEPETLWHRQWKEKFPQEWREVILIGPEPFKEKHIADVKTQNGFVIEFQNSSISTTDIRTRENFYNKMVWVVNAAEFKDNFKIRSIVNRELRYLEEKISSQVSRFEMLLKDNVREAETNYRNAKSTYEYHKSKPEYKQHDIDRIHKYIQDLGKLVEDFLQAGRTNTSIYGPTICNVFEILRESVKKANEFEKKYIELTEKQKMVLENILIFNAFKDIEINGIKYKEIDHSNLGKNTFHFGNAVKKDEARLMFPEVVVFDSFEYYKAFKFNKDYIFFIDPKPFLDNYNDSFAKLQKQIANCQTELATYKEELKGDIIKILEIELKKEYENKNNLELELIKETGKVETLKKSVDYHKATYEIEVAEYREQLIKDNKSKKFSIMKEYKGQYEFYWKHERKTWQISKCPIYFDVGEDYLFLKTGVNSFNKIIKLEFINLFLNSKNPI